MLKLIKIVGTNLAPIILRKATKLEHIRGWTLAVDANNMIYQFLALIRLPNGSPLRDSKGRITSHLLGLAMRTTKLMLDYNLRLVFIFDGPPHPLKKKELEKRRKQRERAYKEWLQALKEGDYQKAFSKAVAANILTKDMIEDAKKLLTYMGIPWIQAPSDAEAQGAYIVKCSKAHALATNDYDALLYGSPLTVRYLTITGFDYLPSKGIIKPLLPEIIDLNKVLKNLGITREQLIDIAILVGTDFNEGIKGIGPKKALKLIKIYGSLERLPSLIKEKLPPNYDEIREIFLKPRINKDFNVEFKPPNEEKLYEFLCEEHNFSEEKVNLIVDRLKRIRRRSIQRSLLEWFS